MKVIIIEDDLPIRKGITLLLQRYAENMELIGVSGSVAEGFQLIEEKQPDVLFLDIQLSDGSSFDILDKMQKKLTNYKPILIFITAYQEFAVKAFKFSALDYLLKPIDHLEFASVIEKINNNQKKTNYEQIEMLLENLNKPTKIKKIALNSQTSTHIIALKDIIRCESDTNYTRFFIIDDKELIISKTLKEFDELLTKEGFERIHQSHLININYIKQYNKKDGFFIMTDGTDIPIATRKIGIVNQIINKITI